MLLALPVDDIYTSPTLGGCSRTRAHVDKARFRELALPPAKSRVWRCRNETLEQNRLLENHIHTEHLIRRAQ